MIVLQIIGGIVLILLSPLLMCACQCAIAWCIYKPIEVVGNVIHRREYEKLIADPDRDSLLRAGDSPPNELLKPSELAAPNEELLRPVTKKSLRM